MREHKKNTVKTGRKRFTTVAGSAAAVVLSAAIVVTSVWHDSIEAQAADTLLGIEKLRNQVELSGKEYTILEIVPDKSAAEIGFWVDGYEPVLGTWDEKGNWLSWKDQLVNLPTLGDRKEFIEGKKQELLRYYSDKYASTDKEWKEDFPVYGEEDEYKEPENDESTDGFEEISGSSISKTGYFTQDGGSGEKYQIAFKYVGKNVISSDVPQDAVYYEEETAINIKDVDWESLPDDVWVYQKLNKLGTGEYEYEPHLWRQIKEGYEPSSVSDDLDPGKDDDKDDDKDKDGAGGGNEGGDEGGNGGDEGDNGDNGGTGGNEGGDEGGDEGEIGGGDEGGTGGNEGGDEGGSDNGGTGGNEGGSDNGGTGGSEENGSAALSVRTSPSQGRWIKMVSEDQGEEKPDPEEKPDSEGKPDPEEKPLPGEEPNPEEEPDPEEEPAPEEEPEEEPGPDGEDDRNSISANTTFATGDYGDYFLVKFKRIEGSTQGKMCYAVKDPYTIKRSTDGYWAYYFKEVELSGDEVITGDDNRQAQKYTFVGKTIYCKNTFKSNEWFKKYALDMDAKDFQKFTAKVITLTPKELNEMEILPEFDFLYLNSGLQSSNGFVGGEGNKNRSGAGGTADDEAEDPDETADDEKDAPDEAGTDDEVDAPDETGTDDEGNAPVEEGTDDEKDAPDEANTDDEGDGPVETNTVDTNAADSGAGFKLYVETGEGEQESEQESGQESASGQNAVPYGTDNDLNDKTLQYLVSRTVAGALPCLVDGAILYVKGTSDTGTGDAGTGDAGTGDTGESVASAGIKVNEDLKATRIFRLAAIMCQELPEEWFNKNSNNLEGFALDKLLDGIVEDADKNFVTENVYCRLDAVSIINKDFHTPTIYKDDQDMEQGFQKVLDEILLDNSYRAADSSGNYKALSTDIGQSTAVRHIINYQNRRKVETKEKIKVLEIQPAMADKPELTLAQIKKWAPGVKEAEITVMTTAEFIGKIEKLNETYDLIYIGTSEDHLNVKYWDWQTPNSNTLGSPSTSGKVSAGTVFNDSNMDGLIYYNIGDLRAGATPLTGQLDTEYVNGNRDGDVFAYNYFRYGGNDITKEKEKALISFLNGSYPVIVADDFMEQPVTVFGDADYKGPRVSLSVGEYTREDLNKLGGVLAADVSSIKVKEGYRITIFDGNNFDGNSLTLDENTDNLRLFDRAGKDWNNCMYSAIVEKVEDKTSVKQIDEDHIDNCTHLYDFVKAAMKKNYTNFYVWSEIEDDSELFKFYLNRPKVSMEQIFVNGERKDDGEIRYINPGTDGKYKLEFQFAIHNEGAASANSRYRCRLYIDINSDGKFSEEEEVPDINLTQGGGYASADGLYADREYTLTRGVPDGYKGLLPWKVEITQADNAHIYASMSGYTKLSGMEKEKLDVIQIKRSNDAWSWAGDPIDLEREFDDGNSIYHALLYGGVVDGVEYKGISEDYEINVDCMTVPEYEAMYYENPDCMSEYNMLILGFSDMYENFSGTSEEGPMSAIVDFINSGKSVLFAHDTTSFVNYPHSGTLAHVDKTNPGSTVGALEGSDDFAYSLNKYVRGLVGMDRYGILSGNGDILRRGQALGKGSSAFEAIISSGKDVAYEPKSNKERTVPQVHGYTYHTINSKDMAWNGAAQKKDYTPAELDPDRDGTFSNTFRNIRYDRVYYEGGGWDDPTEYGDLQYSWSGAINLMCVTQVNKGQITEYPYHLPEKFEIATTHGQYYELDFTADDDGDGQSDLVVWYCLGARNEEAAAAGHADTIYSASPNDVRNNYYIYNKGNVTYTGMGHSAGSNLPYTVDEAKLFINTIIAAYQAGVKQPNITVLKSGLQEAPEMKTMYRYYDTSFSNPSGSPSESLDYLAVSEDSEKIYFRVQDLNFVKGTRAIATHVFYETNGGGETISVGGKEISVNRLADNMYDATDDSPADANNLKSNGIYYILVPKSILEQCDDGLNLYFEAQTTITTNTVKQNQYITDKVYAKLKVLKAFLFDLE